MMFRDLCFNADKIFERECRLCEDMIEQGEGRKRVRWQGGETMVVVESE